MFLTCLAEIAPEYKPKLKWFDISYSGNFCGPMGMNPLGVFKDYVDIYTRVIRLMLQRLENPWEIKNPNQDALSDRWIGWLSERFYAFFIFANNLSVYEVPIVFLEEKDKNNNFMLGKKDQQLKVSEELTNSLHKELKGQRTKTFLWKVGTYAGIIASTYLILIK
jgi:hypothetical protein